MALDDDIERLRQQPLLGCMEREALRLVAFSADKRHYRAGDVIARAGEPALVSHLVVGGAVALDETDDGGRASYVAGPGALIGELALFSETTRPATLIAREPTVLLEIKRSVVNRVLGEFPDSAVPVREKLAERLRGFVEELGPIRRRLDRITP